MTKIGEDDRRAEGVPESTWWRLAAMVIASGLMVTLCEMGVI